jgi:cyclophilin family peptidyl-prolyl cis-trans isomerase/HEAT repeat protein
MNNRLFCQFLQLVTLISFTTYFACVPPEYNREKYDGVTIDFNDKNIQDIYGLLQRQKADSLLPYLRHDNPTYRYLTATALGSLKDSVAVDSLARILRDEFADVRVAAAYALGQIGNPRAESLLLAAYESRDTSGRSSKFNGTVMEAIGKCGTAARLADLCNITTFKMTDTALIEGQAYGIYRYGLRDITSPEAVKKMANLVASTQIPRSARLVAANYLARVKLRYDTTVTNIIAPLSTRERDNDIRMALVKALGKANTPLSVFPTLESIYRLEIDPRVKVNLLMALKDMDYKLTNPLLFNALRERNIHVANTAAELLVSNGSVNDAQVYKMAAADLTLQNSTRRIMAGAALKYLVFRPRTRDSLNQALIAEYQTSKNQQDKANLLKGLAQNGWNYDLLRTEALKADNPPIIRTAAANALASVTTAPDFYRTFKGWSAGIKKNLKAIMMDFIRTGDAGVATIGAETLVNPASEFNRLTLKDSIPQIYQIMQNLKMPEQLETYDALFKAVKTISDSVDIKKRPLSQPRSVDWTILNNLSVVSNATIRTTKGDIKLRLLPQHAPISVINFIRLSRSNFFSGKTFHRVVPNFVVQSGCPRGDGYGSLDYTIPSELTNLHYNTEGYVGMASAGNHTECSQWFITHSPSLHLDPNYTIFAKVVEGMDVVQKIEVGDVVETVIIN